MASLKWTPDMLRVVMKHLIATNRSSWPNLDLSNCGTTSAALTEQLNQRAEFRVTPLHQRTLKAVVDKIMRVARLVCLLFGWLELKQL